MYPKSQNVKWKWYRGMGVKMKAKETIMEVYGTRLMCTGLMLLKTAAQDGTEKMAKNRGVPIEIWNAFFAHMEFRPSSAPHAMNDLVRRGLAIKSKDGQTYYITEAGFYYTGRLEQIRPPKGSHRQPSIFHVIDNEDRP